MTGGKIKDIVSKEKSSNQILGLRYKDEAGEIESLLGGTDKPSSEARTKPSSGGTKTKTSTGGTKTKTSTGGTNKALLGGKDKDFLWRHETKTSTGGTKQRPPLGAHDTPTG